MPANARNTKAASYSLPTLKDVEDGKVGLDDYERAHGEDAPEWTLEDFRRAKPASEIAELAGPLKTAGAPPRAKQESVDISPPVAVRFVNRDVVISLADGRDLRVPLTWYPDLVTASESERLAFELTSTSVKWPAFSEEAKVADILRTQHKIAALERARGQRGPQKAPTKDRVGLRLDHEVVEHFRATGPGWQSRINDVLVAHVKKQS